MFVQIIEGTSGDPDAIRRAGEAWERDVRPVAEGFLGSTGGVADDGTAIIVARFADRAAADANNERPEQQAWYEANRAMFAGEPSFTESEDVEELFGGGSDDAGFVQVVQGQVTDRRGLTAFEDEWNDRVRAARPDLIGGLRVWHDDGRVTEVNYFTSEAEARANEAAMAERLGDALEKYMALLQPDRWLDLRDPFLQ